MFYRTILVCLLGFFLVKIVKTDPVKINFTIHSYGNNTLFCDHPTINGKIYTVLEGGTFIIFSKYKRAINHFICHDYTYKKENFNYRNNRHMKNESTFVGEQRMGTLWNCTILTLQNVPLVEPKVQYKNDNYTAAYCFMKIHVRRKEAPQTILVNNMVVPAVRENQTEKDVDFTAEYHYVDGDIVNVTCINLLNKDRAPLTMEYEMAGIKNDKSTVKDISSSTMIGLVTKLHAGHNNSYMICTNTGPKDYTKVMIRFVMLTKPNIVRISINGMILRQRLTNAATRKYEIKYKLVSNQPMKVMCEVEQNDVELLMLDDDFGDTKRKKTGLILHKKTELSFHLKPGDNKSLDCAADYVKGGLAESVYIEFTTANFPIDQYPSLHMTLPSNGTVMKLYNKGEEKSTVVIVYEFQQDEKLQLTCGPLVFSKEPASPVLYLQLDDNEPCKSAGCYVSLPLQPTREHVNTPIVCYLKEEHDPGLPSTTIDEIFKVIKLILREKVSTPSTTSSTSTTSTTTTTSAGVVITAQEGVSSAATSPDYYKPPETPEKAGIEDSSGPGSNLPMIAGSAACAVIICLVIAIIFVVKFRKRNDSQGVPQNRSYENLAEPSETSIPAYPPQWENNYAVPIDRRTDDTTYSVPCPPADLYATPTPKNLRNKKQKPLDPTYAVLTTQKGQPKKNAFKESDDPNYSEVYANRQEENYAKVLPKSVRNQMEQDNPYSYVTNDPPYVNTGDSEPMYSEVAKAQGAQYANLNSSHYANSNASEYVEPTYCEPQKRKK